MTRDQTIRALSRELAALDGFAFQVSPTMAQMRVEARYMARATKVVEHVEGAMEDFKWRPA